jgi:hypothetical protein
MPAATAVVTRKEGKDNDKRGISFFYLNSSTSRAQHHGQELDETSLLLLLCCKNSYCNARLLPPYSVREEENSE